MNKGAEEGMPRVSPGNNEQTSLAGVEALWRGLVGYNAESIRLGPHHEGPWQ